MRKLPDCLLPENFRPDMKVDARMPDSLLPGNFKRKKPMSKLSYPERFDLADFIRESNMIESLYHDPHPAEIAEAIRFLSLSQPSIADLQQFVMVNEPKAVLRDKVGLNVRIGRHLPPAGAPGIRKKLQAILDDIEMASCTPYQAHQRYEMLHPFTDGNGRSGRILWLWMVQEAPLGFLRTYYYQSLDEARA
jgi:Fic/DOC family